MFKKKGRNRDKDDGILVVPRTTYPPPKLGSEESFSKDYHNRLFSLLNVASITGCCQHKADFQFPFSMYGVIPGHTLECLSFYHEHNIKKIPSKSCWPSCFAVHYRLSSSSASLISKLRLEFRKAVTVNGTIEIEDPKEETKTLIQKSLWQNC